MSKTLDKIFHKAFELEKNGLKPTVAVVGGDAAKDLKENMIYLAGTVSIVGSVYKVNVSGNILTIIETKDEFLEVYSNEKI